MLQCLLNLGQATSQKLNPYEHIAGGSLSDIAEAAPENRVLKVSSASDPKTVAGVVFKSVFFVLCVC
jgi:hypothetical protein